LLSYYRFSSFRDGWSGYDDAITRKFVEQITVLDAETIRIKFRYPGPEVDKKLN